jgi:hypothetical protein
MNKYIKYIAGAAFVAGSLFAISCEKSVSDQDFGSTSIYMPQATVSGGMYNVPAGRDSSSFNYDIEGGKVNIMLGVYRSGKSAAQAYSVNVVANADTINTLIASNALDPNTTVVLPSAMFTMPSTVAVKDGDNKATFYLSVDKAQLKNYAGKKLAIGVKLTNPSKYTLHSTLSSAIVVINVDAIPQ